MYEPSPFDTIRDQVAQYEATDGAQGGTLQGRPLVILTTRGARTRLIRKTPLLRIRYGPAYVVVASYGGAPMHPAWYHNLVADPLVWLQDGAERMRLLARQVTAEERVPVWEAADAVWPDLSSYRRSAAPREIPLILLHSA